VSRRVGSTRSSESRRDRLRRKMDWPRSPWAAAGTSAELHRERASSPSWRSRRLTSSREASGPAMNEAGSPGARWISTTRFVAPPAPPGPAPGAGGRRRSSRPARVAGRSLEPDVPEVRLVGRRSPAAPCGRRRARLVAELDAPDVLVEDLLHSVPNRLALPGSLSGERFHQLLLSPRCTTKPAPGCTPRRWRTRARVERDARREESKLGLVATLNEREASLAIRS